MADSNLPALTAVAALDGTELLYLVDDPAGTPLDRKVTLATLRTWMGLAPAGANNAAASTTSITKTDLLAVSGLNIAQATPISIMFRWRLANTSGTPRGGRLYWKINSTALDKLFDIPTFAGSSSDSGTVHILLGPNWGGDGSNFVGGMAGVWSRANGTLGVGGTLGQSDSTTNIPTAAMTSITIQGDVDNATDCTLHVDELRVFTYPT